MNDIKPLEILEKLYRRANKKLTVSFVAEAVKDKLEFICRCNSNKAPIRFLLSCLLAKIHNPGIDIRKPYTEIEGNDTYSGRYYDEREPTSSVSQPLKEAFLVLRRAAEADRR